MTGNESRGNQDISDGRGGRRFYHGLTVEQHIATAERLKAATRAAQEIVEAYGKSSREGRTARGVVTRLGVLLAVLDGTVCRETSPAERYDPRHLATSVYGPGRLARVDTRPENSADRFAGWKREDD